ncbi:hypothetical protein VNO78_11834 [Psophocarpus tetragonolobus]|uniref:SHSP domain-containing protein n=1 Tax=Psophocarpus tetragonolobus TaxID=3891 RepID=A0AAN9XNT6_PSOTE
MSMIPSTNPFGDSSPFTALSTSVIPSDAVFMSSQLDWQETPEAHVLKAHVPGLNREEVKVQLTEGRLLQVSGERKMQKEDENDTCHRVERSGCRFKKCFTLPQNANSDQVMASIDNGVLTITVPKMLNDTKPIQNA